MISASPLQRLREQIASKVDVSVVSNTVFSVDFPLTFPDGDQCRIFVRKSSETEWTVSDGGSSIMRAGYASDVDILGKGHIGRFRQIVEFYGLSEKAGELSATAADVGDAVFTLAQASLDVVHLAGQPKEKQPRPRSHFAEHLHTIIQSSVRDREIQTRWHDQLRDPGSLYTVPYRIAGPATPIFIFSPSSDTQCMHATMSCLFHRNSTTFRSIAIYESEDDIRASEARRLNNEVDKSFPSLHDEQAIRTFLEHAA